MSNQTQQQTNKTPRDRDYVAEFNFTTAHLDAAAEVMRSRHSGPTSDTDIGQWNRETFQAALKAACKARDGVLDEAGNVRQTPQRQKVA